MAPVKITETHMDSRNQGPQNGGIDNGLGSYTYPVYKNLDPSTLTEGKVVKFNLVLTANALETVNVPVLAYRSRKAGPTVGITCAIHGNEINGIPVIQKLFEDINNNSLELLSGTVIGVPVVNVPGFLASIRQFDDESKQDLNRLMPGKQTGAAPEQYAHAIFNKIVSSFDYVIDLHTASAGRQNSLYVRADMSHPTIGGLARLMQPQVLVHIATKGSLRGCAQSQGIHALTVEIGNPSVFQPNFINATYAGIRRVIASIGLTSEYEPTPSIIESIRKITPEGTAVCTRSFWVYSKLGGILKVFKKPAERVHPRELIGEIQTIFGDPVEKIYAPDFETVVVGIEANPVAKSGNRVVSVS
ncbi:uncharacterized protein BHQ10_004942 [Talaromyces amestolkiae]|uniref:Succinylglutamate desuccinylase/Aspartoacylase catalytic domain-containing protein n=1 Tax=Talaromyces amestolkiae TaxID=1196081 RepID=A0A364KZF1_TALAM|nr:uncharacterized protein BHQ10_004942 [Talaromyces amestolkiae]RAO68930.1 hypothetical protein BHQ10_004942 [Talaromyces amestolkiae]